LYFQAVESIEEVTSSTSATTVTTHNSKVVTQESYVEETVSTTETTSNYLIEDVLNSFIVSNFGFFFRSNFLSFSKIAPTKSRHVYQLSFYELINNVFLENWRIIENNIFTLQYNYACKLKCQQYYIFLNFVYFRIRRKLPL
jgi:hypothetical protein